MFRKYEDVNLKMVGLGHWQQYSAVSFFLFCIFIALPVTGAEIQSQSYPLTFHIDLQHYLPTSLYIKCDVDEYNMLFPDFLSKENGRRESRFKELVFAIRQNNLEKCLNMTFRKSGLDEEQTRKLNKKAETWASSWRSWCFSDALAGKNLEKLKVLRQLYLGNSSLFIFGDAGSSSPEAQPFRAGLRFVPNPEGTFLWNVKNPDTLESLLKETMRQMAVSPTKFVAVENKQFQYEVPIPDTNDTEHIAYLQFNGEKYDFNIFSDTVSSVGKPTDEIVSFFQMKYLMIREGFPREALAEFYTDKSRERYLEWIKNPKSRTYLEWRFKDWATVEKRVRFVVDAASLYIVLYQRGSSNRLFYSFIIRDPKDRKLKLTNFNFIGFLHDLFNKQKFLSLLSERIGIK